MNEKRLLTVRQFWIITVVVVGVHWFCNWRYGIEFKNLADASLATYWFWLFSVGFFYCQRHYFNYGRWGNVRSHQAGAVVASCWILGSLLVAKTGSESLRYSSLAAIPLFLSLNYLARHYRREENSAEPTPEVQDSETVTGSPLLFWAFMSVSIIFGTLIVNIEESSMREQAEAIVAIEKLGAKHISRDWDGNVDRLDFSLTKITDVGLEHLKSLRNLKSLRFDKTQITDAGLEHLKGLKNLETLSLESTQVTDAGLEHLKGLQNLESLNLGNTQITDLALEHLKELKKVPFLSQVNLKGLTLTNTRVTDAGLEHLKGLTRFESLGLSGTEVTDAGLEHLKGLKKLERLSLTNTKVTDVGLEHLKGLTKLEKLWLSGTQITDAGLVHLKGLSNLEFLYLLETEVTVKGRFHLMEELRSCFIYR